MRTRKLRPWRQAFTLLELLMVLTILGIIAVMVIPHLNTSAVVSKTHANQQNLAEINTAVERWWLEKGAWPSNDLSDISKDLDYFPQGIPQNPLTGATYTLNSTTHRAQ